MDPNAEDRPPTAEVSEVEVEFKSEPAAEPPLQAPQASSIFQAAYSRSGPAKPPSSLANSDGERRWNEDEFQRQLKGEYEAAQQRLGDVVSNNLSRPLRLTSIRLVPPPQNTRSSFLQSILSPFISPSPHLPPFLSFLHAAPPSPRTLHDVLLTTRSVVAHLDKFGIWDMERAGVSLEAVRGGGVDEVGLVLGLVPRGRVFLKAGTEVGGGEGGGNVTARIRNALGGGESLEVNASLGTKTKSAYQASLTTPLLGSPFLSFALSGFAFDRDNTAFASHRESAQGGRAKLSAIAPWGTHDLTYEYIARDIGHLSSNASVSVRELAKASAKSSLITTWTSDTRDDPWTGTSGRLLKMSYEYAGLPGSSESVRYVKSTSHSQISRPLYPGCSSFVSLSSLSTFLLPLTRHPTNLPDRMYLGGPNSLRGWKVGGAGLRDGPDSLGGDLSWAVGASLLTPIPGKAHWPLKVHGFVNAGKVVGYDRDRGFAENILKMFRNPNLSVGLGLMYRLEPVRIELNFTMPLVARKGERLARGFGVGVGIEFL